MTSYFCLPVLCDECLFCFLVLVLEGLVGLHRTIQLQLFGIGGWGIELDYCDVEWFVLETNQDYSVIFEIALKYCILDSFVDYSFSRILAHGNRYNGCLS